MCTPLPDRSSFPHGWVYIIVSCIHGSPRPVYASGPPELRGFIPWASEKEKEVEMGETFDWVRKYLMLGN